MHVNVKERVMQIEANYVDIRHREIYPARIVIEEGTVSAVTKIGTPCSTYLLSYNFV